MVIHGYRCVYYIELLGTESTFLMKIRWITVKKE